ncbi:MAG: DUF4214 domain-containing protein [Acidimicrobiia bacterium]
MLKKISTAVAAMLLVLGAAAPVTADTSSAMEGFLVRVHADLGLGGPSVSDVEAAVLAWEACEASPGSLVMDLLEGPFLAEHGDLNNGDFIAAVYQHALQRTPGTAGAAYWEDLLDRGTPRSAVVLSFSQSAEVIAATETGTSGALGAPCEPELDPGTINPPDPGPGGGSMIELPKPPAPSEPVSELRRSYREALARMSSNAVDETPEGVIHRLYHAVFARPADAEGLKYWESLSGKAYRRSISPACCWRRTKRPIHIQVLRRTSL